MYRGTTPTIYFRINELDDFSSIKDIWITLVNENKIGMCNHNQSNITKTLLNKDIEIDEENKLISISLTQKETLMFTGPRVKVQMKVRFDDENVCVSPIFEIELEDCLNTNIMRDSVKEPSSSPSAP